MGKEGFRSVLTLAMQLLEDCEERDILHLTDFGCNLASDGFYSLLGAVKTRRRRVILYGVRLDDTPLPPVFSNLYTDVYNEMEELPESVFADAVYLGALYDKMTPEEGMQLAVALTASFSTVYLVVPVPDTEDHKKWHILSEVKSMEIKRFHAQEEVLLRVEKKKDLSGIKLFTVTHKDVPMPADDMYVPLWVGTPEGNVNGWPDDKRNPEIAALNPRINECTGLYSIWKYAEADVKGLVHYRRFFRSEENVSHKSGAALLSANEIANLLCRYDILVAQLEFYKQPIAVHMREAGLEKAVTETAIDCFRRYLSDKQPRYVQAFQNVMEGHSFYPCNMLIARKEVFDAYCEWLFSFLPEAADELDFDAYTDNNRRVAGYLAERMLTVWLINQSLRIREMEMILTGGQ